ncbi:MAG: DUF4270 family protein [Bacteroidetes bacterium]|nr:DUF4270 family protein [Bacteroidota bacterium]
MRLNKVIRLGMPIMITIIVTVIFASCTDNPVKFTLDEKFIESQTALMLVDTFSVSLSTVIIDKVTTSGTGSMLLGSYSDNVFGKIRSNSYFQIGIPEYNVIEDYDIYSSLVLAIHYNSYYFGDTTKSQSIFVHQLIENIKLDDNGVINSQAAFKYNVNPIGSIIYTPRPCGGDTIFIKISDVVGVDLFNKLKNESEVLIDNENFINYFHGLVLVTDINSEGSIIGFNASKENVELILSTIREGESDQIIYHVFTLEDSTKQFNNIIHDFSSTPLSPLIKQQIALSNSNTGGVSFLQGGIGLVIRADIPSLSEVLLFKRGLITKAQLSIYPKQNSYNVFSLPPELVIYGTNKQNEINSGALYSSSAPVIDEIYQEETSYTFDVTEYLKDEIADSYIDPENGLLVTLSGDVLNTKFYRSIINSQNRKPKLKIYYLSY